MKRIYFLSVLFIAMITITACKQEAKKEENTNVKKAYSVEPRTTTVNWVAYKTTGKVPVKGQFTKLNIENIKSGASAREALNGVKFSIPVSSVFTNDTIRDRKLKDFFFGKLINASTITGEIHMNNETSGTIDLTLNGISQVLPTTYVISDQMVTLEAVMDLDNWQAQAALDALDVACKELHTGDDGVAKTWSEVKIEVATYLKYE